MKTRSIVLLTVGLTALPLVALAQTDPRLKPSLDAFARTKNIMPDPRNRVIYEAFPGRNGVYHRGLSSSGLVRTWFPRTIKTLPEWAKARTQLNDYLDFYKATVEDGGGALLKVADETNAAALNAFSKKNSNEVANKLHEYVKARQRAKDAYLEEAKAQEEVAAALAQVRAETASVIIRASELEKGQLAARKQAIMDEAKKSGWIKEAYEKVKGLVDVVKGGPTSILTFGVSFVAESVDVLLTQKVLNDHWEELVRISDRDEVLTKAIASEKDQAVKSRLEAAQRRLQASRINLVQAGMKRQIVQSDTWFYINNLAMLEKGENFKLFRELARYNREVDDMALAVKEAGQQYLFMLEVGPLSQAPNMLKPIDDDIAEVKGRSGEDYSEWLGIADNTRAYLAKHAAWYRKEQKEVGGQVTAALGQKQWNLVEYVVSRTLDRMVKDATQ